MRSAAAVAAVKAPLVLREAFGAEARGNHKSTLKTRHRIGTRIVDIRGGRGDRCPICAFVFVEGRLLFVSSVVHKAAAVVIGRPFFIGQQKPSNDGFGEAFAAAAAAPASELGSRKVSPKGSSYSPLCCA